MGGGQLERTPCTFREDRVTFTVGVRARHNGVTGESGDNEVISLAMIAQLWRVFHLARGCCMLLAVRVLLSVEWPEGNDGRYYWEHCAWQDRDDWLTDGQMGLFTITNMSLLYTSQVQIHSTRWYFPDSLVVYFQQTYPFPQFGSQAPQENYNLLMCARWRMKGGDGSYTYHLHRQPLGEDYVQDGQYTPDGLTAQQTRMNTYIAQDRYRTKTGALITEGELAGQPVMWQLRHGTKRRRRRFWLP